MRDIIKITLFGYIIVLLLSEFVLFSARYIFYILPFIVIGIAFLTQKVKLDGFTKNMLVIISIFLIASAVPMVTSVLEGNRFFVRSLKELVFVLPVYFMVIFAKKSLDPNQFTRYLSYFVVLLTLLFFVQDFQSIGSLLRNLTRFLLSSKSDTESTYASVYGILCVYFFVTKKYRLFALALLLVIIGSKRIVLGGVFISILIGTIIERLNLSSKIVISGAVLGNIMMVAFLVNMSSGTYDAIVREYLGISTNQLVMGRAVIYKTVLENFDGFFLFGQGLGSTSHFLQSSNFLINDSRLLHSDLLKIYLELGFILFIVYFYTFYRFTKYSKKTIYVLLYINVLYLTGNTLIFVHVNIIMYLILTAIYVKYENPRGISS